MKLQKQWTRTLHGSIISGLQKVTRYSVSRANTLIFITPLISVAFLLIGCYIGFTVETDSISLWTPSNIDVISNGKWVKDGSGFPVGTYPIHLILHSKGNNVLSMEGVDMLFQALDVFRWSDGYDNICGDITNKNYSTIIDNTGTSVRRTSSSRATTTATKNSTSCDISGVTNFFHDDYDVFVDTIHSDDDLIKAISSTSQNSILNGKIRTVKDFFGFPVESEFIEREENKTLITKAASLKLRIGLPVIEAGRSFEALVISRLLDFRNGIQNSAEGNKFQIEVLSAKSYDIETINALKEDMPLLPAIVAIMCVFSCCVYFKWDRVQSSCLLLGCGAVVTVILSLMTTFGLLFLVGVPFTPLTAVVPFVVLGIGLDDAFIITGSFERTDPRLSTEDRIAQTVHDSGVSIVLTTVTTTVALLLGMLTNVPAMRSFYMYAAPCVLVDFFYQITFFVALIEIDQRRKSRNRIDCFSCIISPSTSVLCSSPSPAAFILTKYSEKLQRSTALRCIVCTVFCSWAVVSCVYCSKLKVSFDFTDLLPSDSFVRSFIAALGKYSDLEAYKTGAFFRDVDFSSIGVRDAIDNYVSDIVQLTNQEPEHFWLYDFENFLHADTTLENLPFDDQIDIFLARDPFRQLYSSQIVMEAGKMTASMVVLPLSHMDVDDAKQQSQFFLQQKEISLKYGDIMKETVGSGQDYRLPFLTFSEDYYMWAFYSVAVDELILTTVLTLATVMMVTFIFLPNIWACLVVMISIVMIYVDVLGIIYFANLSINPVTLVAIIMSIGLLVDYVLHIVLRCFEPAAEEFAAEKHGEEANTRETKLRGVRECLATMGPSVFIGGLSSVLSTIPLLFSTSELKSISIVFFGFVSASLLHGIVFVPALLISWFPESGNHHDEINLTYPGTDSSTTDEDGMVHTRHPAEESKCRDRNDSVETGDLTDEAIADSVCERSEETGEREGRDGSIPGFLFCNWKH